MKMKNDTEILSPRFCLLKNKVLEKRGQTESQIAWLQKSVNLFQDDLALNKKLVTCCLANNYFLLALTSIQKAITRFPTTVFFLKKQIALYFKLDERENALLASVNYSTIFPNDSFGYFKQISALLILKRREAAIELFAEKESILTPTQLLQVYYQLSQYNAINRLCDQQIKTGREPIIWLCQKLRISLLLNTSIEFRELLFQKIIKHPAFEIQHLSSLLPAAKVSKEIEQYLLTFKGNMNDKTSLPKTLKNYLAAVENMLPYINPTASFPKPCIDCKVDLVYTWVDMSDPRFMEKFQKTNGFYPENGINKQCNQFRYTNHGEIKFSLQTVQSYFSEVNHIYIVTNDQYFNLEFLPTSFRNKITFINQEDIIPKDLVSHATFDSNLIETFIWRIPNLAETFLYCCDDYFFGKPVLKTFPIFNAKQVPYAIVQPQSSPDISFLKKLKEYAGKVPNYKTYSYNAYQLFLKEFEEVPSIQDMHLPVILRKEACKQAFQLFSPYWKENFFNNRLRSNESVFTLLLYNWYAIQKGYQVPGPYHLYQQNSLIFNHGLSAENITLLKNKRPLFFCINSLPDAKSRQLFQELATTYLTAE